MAFNFLEKRYHPFVFVYVAHKLLSISQFHSYFSANLGMRLGGGQPFEHIQYHSEKAGIFSGHHTCAKFGLSGGIFLI